MSNAPLRRGIAALALGFTAVTLLAFRPSAASQEPPQVLERPLPERVAALEQLAIEQAAELARLRRLTSGVAAGVAELATAADQAAAGGFAAAGANPAARQALLDGITALHAQVRRAQAPPVAPAADR
ncbi:MAG: hypothetical protein FJ293_14105 [Planctomycetes bacterium]|nr:hypothetical protein [Planctomycetota bacterium]